MAIVLTNQRYARPRRFVVISPVAESFAMPRGGGFLIGALKVKHAWKMASVRIGFATPANGVVQTLVTGQTLSVNCVTMMACLGLPMPADVVNDVLRTAVASECAVSPAIVGALMSERLQPARMMV